MKVSCQACGAKYTIADDKVRGRKVKIRCKSCGTPIVVDGQSEAPEAGAPAAAQGPAISWSVNLSDTDQRTMSTDEIVAAWQSGVVTTDAFVWKDGMADWVAILDCEDLKPLLAQAAPATGAGAPTPFGPTVVTAQAVSARLAGGRGAGVDLFDAGRANATEEEEVATSAPALPTAGMTAYDDGKLTGARNENSVLFSLDALKSGMTNEPKRGGSAPRRPGSPPVSSGDPFAMAPAELGGANPLFSLNTNQALLTAPAPPEPPPPRVTASGAAVAQPMNKLVMYGGGAAGAVILLLLGLLLGRSGASKEDPAPDGSAKEQAAAMADTDSAKKAGDKADKKADDKADEKQEAKKDEAKPAASASAKPEEHEASKAPATTATKPTTVTHETTHHETTHHEAEPKPENTMPSAGLPPFSVSAAQVALTQAASNASSCKKSGGPTGSGKIQVTFATSGRVTTANVMGSPFAGTSVGGCVAGVFRRARVPAYSGNPITVSKSFNIR